MIASPTSLLSRGQPILATLTSPNVSNTNSDKHNSTISELISLFAMLNFYPLLLSQYLLSSLL